MRISYRELILVLLLALFVLGEIIWPLITGSFENLRLQTAIRKGARARGGGWPLPSVVFMFMTRTGLVRPDLWQAWYEDSVARLNWDGINGTGAIEGIIHLMDTHDMSHVPPWLLDRVDWTRNPRSNWEGFGEVMHSILKQSLNRYKLATHFVYLSETHLPLRGADDIYRILQHDPRSRFSISMDCFLCMHKHSWSVLSRPHAEILVAHPREWVRKRLGKRHGVTGGVDELWPFQVLVNHAPHKIGFRDVVQNRRGELKDKKWEASTITIWRGPFNRTYQGVFSNTRVTSHPFTLLRPRPGFLVDLMNKSRSPNGAWFVRKVTKETTLMQPCVNQSGYSAFSGSFFESTVNLSREALREAMLARLRNNGSCQFDSFMRDAYKIPSEESFNDWETYL